MTRTQRSFTPRAVMRDRSESKSGLDKSERKGGAGAHNWGSYADEQDHEFRATFEDNEYDLEEEVVGGLSADRDVKDELASNVSKVDGSLTLRRESTFSEEERQQAREFRANALKNGCDLGAIARTSVAVSTSPDRKTFSATVITDAQTNVTL